MSHLASEIPRCGCCGRAKTGELCWDCWLKECRCLPRKVKP